MVTHAAAFYKYCSRMMYFPGLSRFYVDTSVFFSALVTGWTPPSHGAAILFLLFDENISLPVVAVSRD